MQSDFRMHILQFNGFINHAMPKCMRKHLIHKSYPFFCQGTNMFTYLKFGLPRVLPPGREETSSDFNSSDEEVAARTSRARTRLRPSRSEEFLDRSRDGQDNR